MMNRLWVRLSLGFLLLTWAVLGVVALVVYNSVQASFREYVSERDAALFGSPLIEIRQHLRRQRRQLRIGSNDLRLGVIWPRVNFPVRWYAFLPAG